MHTLINFILIEGSLYDKWSLNYICFIFISTNIYKVPIFSFWYNWKDCFYIVFCAKNMSMSFFNRCCYSVSVVLFSESSLILYTCALFYYISHYSSITLNVSINFVHSAWNVFPNESSNLSNFTLWLIVRCMNYFNLTILCHLRYFCFRDLTITLKPLSILSITILRRIQWDIFMLVFHLLMFC